MRNIASAAAAIKSATGLPVSPIVKRLTPIRSAKKIMARILPSAIAAIGFSGTMPIKRSLRGTASCTALGATAERSTPTPGCKIAARVNPIVMATNVVNKYKPRVRAPNDPNLLGSPIEITPETSVTKTNGTTTIRISRMKRSPIHAMDVTPSPKITPTMTPKIMAPRIRFQSAISNHILIKLFQQILSIRNQDKSELVYSYIYAFVLARRSIVGWQLITIYFLCATTIPIQLFLFPLYFVFAKLGIIGNVIATAFILSAINLPLATFLLRTYVLTIPSEIDDAAFLDGASPIQTFIHIIFPLLRPGLVTVGIIVGLNAWNEFLITSTFQQGQNSFTMTLGYLSMNGTYATDQGAMMAGAFILVAPIILFFIVMQRLFISGMAAGAIKG